MMVGISVGCLGCLRGRQIRSLWTPLGGASDHSHERMMKEETLPSWKTLQVDDYQLLQPSFNKGCSYTQMQYHPRGLFEWASREMEECWVCPRLATIL